MLKVFRIALFLLTFPAQWALAGEQILSFDSDITVHPDATMTVIETIDVVAEGRDIKRGIYREFPTDYKDKYGNRYRVSFDVQSVRRNGYSEPWFTKKVSNGVRLYIGDANRYVDEGEHSYEITYRTSRQLGYFTGHDELYWNVTGNGWGFPINRVTARVRLPDGIRVADMTTEAYTGFFGASGRDYRSWVVDDGVAQWESTRSFAAREGLTLVVTWPKGFVYQPTQADRTKLFFRDNGGLLIVLIGFALMLAYLLKVWSRYGKDPEPGPVFPHYEPPERLSAGACRYVLKMGHDDQCVTAAVLSLAVKGYVTIHQGAEEAIKAAGGSTSIDDAIAKLSPTQRKWLEPVFEMVKDSVASGYTNSFVLEKNASPDTTEPLGPGEKVLLKKLFRKGDFLLLVSTNHREIRKAFDAHKEALQRYYRRAHFFTNSAMVLPAIAIAIVSFLIAVFAGLVTPLVMLVPIVSLAVCAVFMYLMKAPTALGRKVMDRIDGFNMYLEVAEEDDIARITDLTGPMPQQTPELYERYMPFAVAFDMERPWAKQFEQMFTRIAAEQGRSYRPGWYHGRATIHNFSDFSADFGSSFNSAISASSVPPGSSSGSGGGGSSGGGGGGGGGGGW